MAPFFVLNQFLDYLSTEKRFSEHTVTAYQNFLNFQKLMIYSN